MANEKRLIDANVLIEDLEAAEANAGMGAVVARTLIRYVKRCATVDAVEVVRCKDCMWARKKDHREPTETPRELICQYFKHHDRIRGSGKWIPVTERLPDRECIAIGYQNEMVIGYISENRYSKTGFSVEGAGEYLGEVTHWMPLPEPPKEG